MAAREPQNVAAVHYGTDWLKVDWDDNTALSGDAPTGFKIWYDDTSVTVPVWTVPPAIDNVLRGGDGASPVQHYSVMINTVSGVACWWETFEEYVTAASMEGGGENWGGPAVVGDVTVGWTGNGDDFESYPEGVVDYIMTGGIGWGGPAVYGTAS